jgi:hypothetical protein
MLDGRPRSVMIDLDCWQRRRHPVCLVSAIMVGFNGRARLSLAISTERMDEYLLFLADLNAKATLKLLEIGGRHTKKGDKARSNSGAEVHSKVPVAPRRPEG